MNTRFTFTATNEEENVQISVTDADAFVLAEAFGRFLLAAGYSPSVVDKILGMAEEVEETAKAVNA